jgi:hypothetical protein
MFGDVRGRDGLIEWLWGLFTQGLWITEHDVFGNDEHLSALSVMGARRAEVDGQTGVVSVFHFRQGTQLERWLHPEDLGGLEANPAILT